MSIDTAAQAQTGGESEHGAGEFGALVPRNRYLLLVAVAALVVSALQLVRVIDIPIGQVFSGSSASLLSTQSLLDFMRTWGYVSLFALMMLESASVPIPSEIILPFAGYLVSLGAMNFELAVIVSTAAGLVGALVDYYLAYFLGRPFVISLLRAFRIDPRALGRAEGWFERSGQWTVFAARFVPLLRSLISLPAGLFRMRMWVFVVMTVIGCLGWATVLVYAGAVAGTAIPNALGSSATVADGIAAVVAAAAVLYVVYFAAGGRRKSAGRRAGAISPASSVS